MKKQIILTKEIILLFVLMLLFLLFFFLNRQFVSFENLMAMLRNMVVSGILALGLTPLMISGGIDLSFGATVSLSTVVTGFLYDKGYNLSVSILLGFLVPIIFGLINGLLVEHFDLLPIILTLGTMSIAQALALVISKGSTFLVLTDSIYYFATGSFLKIPYPVLVLLFLIFIFWIVTLKSKFGRSVYLIGSNPKFAYLVGINIKKVKISLYILAGFMTGIAAFTNLSLTGVGIATSGLNLTLPVLSAVLLGGISLSGGKGSIWGSLIGILILTVLNNGLLVLNVFTYYIQIFQGLALILIILIYEKNIFRSRRKLN